MRHEHVDEHGGRTGDDLVYRAAVLEAARDWVAGPTRRSPRSPIRPSPLRAGKWWVCSCVHLAAA